MGREIRPWWSLGSTVAISHKEAGEEGLASVLSMSVAPVQLLFVFPTVPPSQEL